MNDLGSAVALLERSKFNLSLALNDAARRECLESIKLLNGLLKAKIGDPLIVKPIALNAMSLYESIKSSTTTFEDKLMWLGSKIHGQFFPPMIEFDGVTSFDIVPELDATRPLLSLPDTISATFMKTSGTNERGVINDLENIYQDLLTNCSFVCAILSIIHINPDLVYSLLSHVYKDTYKVKLYLNGCFRLVTLDNKLPLVDNGRNLVMRSLTNPAIVWPALLEKAYLMVMGQGYNFQGSNMAVDTFMLLGWIPEVVHVLNGHLYDGTEADDTLAQLFRNKKVLLGLGVGQLSDKLAAQIGLIPGHDYAVVDMRLDETTGVREILIRNPWLAHTDGTQSIRWVNETELYHFSFLYINWLPHFKHSTKVNFIAQLNSPGLSLWSALYNNPQYTLTVPPHEGKVWLLLERHLLSTVDDPSTTRGEIVIGITIYDTKIGERVFSDNQCHYICKLRTGTNNRTELVKLELPPGKEFPHAKSYTVVINSSENANFTLTAYSDTKVQLHRAKPKYPHIILVPVDSWDTRTSGGNYALPTYIYNPQYTLRVTKQLINLYVGLVGELADQYYNVHIFSSDSTDAEKPLRSISLQKLVKEENYHIGSVVYHVPDLKPGTYRMVCSTYTALPNHKPTQFCLRLNHDSTNKDDVTLTKCYNALGLFVLKETFSWEQRNRLKICFRTTSRQCKVTFHIKYSTDLGQSTDDSTHYRPKMRASIFNRTTEQPVQVNEKWNDSLYGVFVDCILPDVQEYILLVERFELGSGLAIIEIGSSRMIELRK